MPSLILVVDSHAGHRQEMSGHLRAAGFTVATAPDTERLDLLVARMRPDVVVVDTATPTALPWAALGRGGGRTPSVPVVIVSASGRPDAAIAALDAGAADYVAKPYHPGEFAARVRRRVGSSPGRGEGDRLTVGPVVMNLRERRVTVRGRTVPLTTMEFDLLHCLARRPGEVFSRSALLRLVWGHSLGDASTVTVHVRRLRAKIERDPADPQLVRTRWGVGYWLVAEDPEADAGSGAVGSALAATA